MADLIASTIYTQTLTAGGTTRLQVWGGTPTNGQWVICDFELPAADANTLSNSLVKTPVFYVGNQTVDLSAASNTSYTMNNTAGKPIVGNIAAGQYLSIATAGGSLANTVVSVVSVTNNTTVRVTYVSGANAASVAAGDIVQVTSPAANNNNTLNYAQANSPLNGITNAI